jgi:hypothetical protein
MSTLYFKRLRKEIQLYQKDNFMLPNFIEKHQLVNQIIINLEHMVVKIIIRFQ